MCLIFVAACLRRKIFNGEFFSNYGIYLQASCVNHAREHVALARKHPLTAQIKGVGAHEYILARAKFKLSSTVSGKSIALTIINSIFQ